MSAGADAGRSARRLAAELGLAPHVDDAWAEDFVLELRLRGVRGADIGAALSEVESHCGESEESARDAFGDPREYAVTLELPVDSGTSTRALLRAVAPNVVQVVGMLVLVWGFTAWREGGPLELTTGQLLSVLGVVVGVALLVRSAEPVLRLVVHHPVLLWLAAMAGFAVMVGLQLLLDAVVGRVAAGVGIAVGAATLVGGVAWTLVRGRRGSLEDPITSPLAGEGTGDRAAAPGPLRRLMTSAEVGTAMIPAWTLILLAVAWLLTR